MLELSENLEKFSKSCILQENTGLADLKVFHVVDNWLNQVAILCTIKEHRHPSVCLAVAEFVTLGHPS